METSKYNKSAIMTEAWRIYRNNRSFNWSFSKCLTIAWENAKIRMANEIIRVKRLAKAAAKEAARLSVNMTHTMTMTPEMIKAETMARFYSGTYNGD
jgi:hypothetical protein